MRWSRSFDHSRGEDTRKDSFFPMPIYLRPGK